MSSAKNLRGRINTIKSWFNAVWLTEKQNLNPNNLNVGIFSWFGYDLPLRERSKLIKEAGFNSTFLWYGVEEKLYESGEIEAAPTIVRNYGLNIETIHASYQNCSDIWYQKENGRNKKIEEYFDAISFASKHKIPCVVIHVTGSSLTGIPNDYGLNSISKIINFAEAEKVYVAIENTRNMQFVNHVFENIKSPYLKLCYDSSHDFLYGNPPLEILKRWGDLLYSTHLSDNDGKSDKHWLPFTGVVDWNKLGKNLYGKHLLQSVMIEAFPQETNRPTASEFLNLAYQSAIQCKGNVQKWP